MPEKPEGASFFEAVYEVVTRIPYGRITSYGAIAEFLGLRGSARMVGWAMNASHTSRYNLPAHRVVNRNGLLSGKYHFDGPEVMRELLESEGIRIENNMVKEFDKLFWDPNREIAR